MFLAIDSGLRELSVNVQAGLDLEEKWFLNLGMRRNCLEHLWKHTFLGLRICSSKKPSGVPLLLQGPLWAALHCVRASLYHGDSSTASLSHYVILFSHTRETEKLLWQPQDMQKQSLSPDQKTKTSYTVAMQHRASSTGYLSVKNEYRCRGNQFYLTLLESCNCGRRPCRLNP